MKFKKRHWLKNMYFAYLLVWYYTIFCLWNVDNIHFASNYRLNSAKKDTVSNTSNKVKNSETKDNITPMVIIKSKTESKSPERK